MEMLETVYRPGHPLNLRQTLSPLLRGAMDPTHRWDGAALWRTANTPEGPATLRLSQHGDEVRAVAWGPGAAVVITGVPELCGKGDDWSGLDLSPHPYLREVWRGMPGLRLLRTNAVFEAIMAAVFEQKVTGIEARRAWRYLLTKYGTEAPGPAPHGMRVFPDAASGVASRRGSGTARASARSVRRRPCASPRWRRPSSEPSAWAAEARKWRAG